MKITSRRILIAAVLILLSAGVLWQQQRTAAPAPAPEVSNPAEKDLAKAASGATTPIAKGGNIGTAGPGSSPAVATGVSTALPREMTAPPGNSPRVAGNGSSEYASPPANNSMPLEPLISPVGKQSLIARDGTPLRVELNPGQPASAVELQAWTDDQTRNADGQYNWRFKVKVPAGGLLERPDPAGFTAPEAGYQADFDFRMDQALPKNQWVNSVGKSFFVHFNNNTYGLLNVQMVAGGAHFVTVKAWVNPAAGSRNLQPPPAPPVKQR